MTGNGLPRYSRHIEDAALTVGWPALVVAQVLDRFLEDAPADTDRVRILRQVAADHRRAGEAWQRSSGTLEPAEAEPAATSRHERDQHGVGADEAADVLGCSPGYVRRLARDGRLAAWRGPNGAWRFDRADVEAEAHHRQDWGAA